MLLHPDNYSMSAFNVIRHDHCCNRSLILQMSLGMRFVPIVPAGEEFHASTNERVYDD